MKKTNLSLQSALLLLGTAGLLTACSSEDVLGGGGSQSAGTVKTQFAINIPAGGALANQRLADNIVQGQDMPVFRGMQDVVLVPTTGNVAEGGTLSSAQQLGDILANGDLNTNSNTKVYYNVELATGIDHILFYGQGKKDGAATNESNGVLTGPADWTSVSNTDAITFSLVPIAASGAGDNPVVAALNTMLSSANQSNAWSQSEDFKIFYYALQGLKAGSVVSVTAALTDLKAGVDAVQTQDESEFKTTLSTAIQTALSSLQNETYPRNIGLPDGFAQIAWSSQTNNFKQVDAGTTIGTMVLPDATKYVHPAALYYYVNSDLKTSNAPQAANYGTNNWTSVQGLYTDGTSVTEQTVSVLMNAPVQYAVARLDVNAKFGLNVTDNHKETVDVTASDGMQLKGLLIGGQKNVKYDFTVNADDTESKTVYDQSFTATKLTTSNMAAAFKTLVLENSQADPVIFALELVNNTGFAFQGIDGLVPDGGTFYLVGTLTPQTEKADNHVFLQDYTTTANVTINSLAHAYNCIPDLENPSLELGLSVNLEWEEGLVDNVVIE